MKSKFFFNHLALFFLLLLCTNNLFAQTILNFRSYIDGSDYVHIQGQNVWYEHRNWQLPGKWDGANEPTYINGDPWFPDWSLYPLSDKYSNLTPPLPSSGNVNLTLEIIAARGSVTLTQAPNSNNGYEAIILFDDDLPGGPDWYEINLKLDSCTPPKIKIEYLVSLDICQTHSVLLSANGNSGRGYTYQWMRDNLPIPGAKSRRYTATIAGSYTVLVKNNFGCSTLSNPAIVTSCSTGQPSGLIGLWHLDGNTTDASGNGHNGTIVGTVTQTAGRCNNAYQFDGNSAIDCGNVDLNSTGEFSVSAWVKSNDPYVTEVWRMVVSKLNGSTGGPLELFAGDGRSDQGHKGVNYIAWNGGTGVHTVLSPFDPVRNARDGAWHHLALTFKSGSQIVYFDGVQVGSTTSSAPLPNTSSNFRIGGINFGPYHHPWIGDIDEVSAYNRALSSSEIQALAAGCCIPPKIKIEHLGSLDICQTHSVLLSANGNSGKGYTYQWMRDNIAIPGAISRRYTATIAGSYTVLVTKNLDCSILSNPAIVTSCSTTKDQQARPSLTNKSSLTGMAAKLNVTPNPVVKMLNIVTEGLPLNNLSTIYVLSLSGATIKTIQPNTLNKTVQVDVSSFQPGTYIIKVVNGEKVMYKQFIKL